ncbi:DUF4920 domain-containing protein [Pontibacter beigongshangensis]|uniref:DUF4920 domain-containing protein n=1 Tax=Pontibacter beigongshangensis TaxID=2574733 RepID=UPI001F50A590|nr:DUF4920 domain-containing protein [Pontibacter beigongshangensis]
MKSNKLLLLAALAATCSCSQPNPETKQQHSTEALSEAAPVAGTVYGDAIVEENVMSVAELQQAAAQSDSVQATVTAEIVESCQAKGCWMDVRLPDNSTMKVKFRDYGFFVPTEDLSGRQVVFSGIAKKKVVSVAERKHYAEDAGKSAAEIAAITTPSEELTFVADVVMLRE